jgi:hypothetical protein
VFRQLRTSGDVCRDRGGGVADTGLQLHLVVSTSKSRGGRFARFGPQKPGKGLGATRGISREFVLRQSVFVKRSWSSDVQRPFCP